MGIVAAGVVAYAFYTLTTAERPQAERASPAARRDGDADADGVPGRGPRPGSLGVKPAAVSKAGDGRPQGGPPPRPEPSVSLEEARTDFQAVLDELDEAAKAGRPLTTPEWTEYYKKGNDALHPLLQHLAGGDTDQTEELRRANMDLRTKLRAIEPGRPPPESP